MDALSSIPEHGSVVVAVSAENAETIRRSRLRLEVEELSPSRYLVTAGRYVGLESLGGLTIRVHPKLPIGRLLYILSVASETIEFGAPSSYDSEHGEPSMLPALYAVALGRALGWGSLCDYSETNGDVDLIRGVLEVESLATRRFGVIPPIPCRYDEYTSDIEPNRRLLAAARLLATFPGVRLATALELGRLVAQLSQAVALVGDANARRQRYIKDLVHRQLGRGAEDYLAALDLATVALKHGGLDFADGRVAGPSFVVDMDKAFEEYVSKSLQHALGAFGARWRERPTTYLDVANTIWLSPDMIWSDSKGNAKLIIDAKWKQTKSGQSSDIKQVAVYCLALGVRRAALVYGEAEQPRDVEVRHSGVTIRITSLPLDGTRQSLDARVRKLASELSEFADCD